MCGPSLTSLHPRGLTFCDREARGRPRPYLPVEVLMNRGFVATALSALAIVVGGACAAPGGDGSSGDVPQPFEGVEESDLATASLSAEIETAAATPLRDEDAADATALSFAADATLPSEG